VVITFLTDYGVADDFVGVCHAVMAGIAPDVRVVDLTHGVARHDVRGGALVLRRVLPYAPAGVHLAVVDPEVGGARRAVALRCAQEDRVLVGPDNGLLLPAAEAFGGVVEAVEVSRSPHRLEPVAATFHGRDLFAPVAAHLAAGAPLAGAGDPIEPGELVPLVLPTARVEPGRVVAHVLAVDRFGNVTLDAGHEQLAGTGLRLGRRVRVGEGEGEGEGEEALYARTFADVPAGDLLLYEDAYRTLALAVNRGSAAERLGVGRDDELVLREA
jgi:S-adenosylmethionine hydrolase